MFEPGVLLLLVDGGRSQRSWDPTDRQGRMEVWSLEVVVGFGVGPTEGGGCRGGRGGGCGVEEP
jgi:hypothetical protein